MLCVINWSRSDIGSGHCAGCSKATDCCCGRAPDPTRDPLRNGNAHGTDSDNDEQSRHAGSSATAPAARVTVRPGRCTERCYAPRRARHAGAAAAARTPAAPKSKARKHAGPERGNDSSCMRHDRRRRRSRRHCTGSTHEGEENFFDCPANGNGVRLELGIAIMRRLPSSSLPAATPTSSTPAPSPASSGASLSERARRIARRIGHGIGDTARGAGVLLLSIEDRKMRRLRAQGAAAARRTGETHHPPLRPMRRGDYDAAVRRRAGPCS